MNESKPAMVLDTHMKGCILIPARGGSKGIKKKNLVIFDNKPLIDHVIEASVGFSSKLPIFVSSESDDILFRANRFKNKGVVSLRRPQHLCEDLTTDFEVFTHFFETVGQNFDYAIHLRATFPKINSSIIQAALMRFIENYELIDSLRSVIPAESPYKMWLLEDDTGLIRTFIDGNRLHSSPRQILPHVYAQNACIDIIKKETVLLKKSMVGDSCLGFVMDKKWRFDIDTLADLLDAESRSHTV